MILDNLSLTENITEDSEFIPLLSKDEEDSLLNTDTPAELAILPLRNTVLFPGVVIPISAGRDKSLKLLRDAYKDKQIIGVTTQKDASNDDPDIQDINIIGTAAKIHKMIKLPDGNTTVILQGLRRFRIEEFTTTEPYFKAKIDLIQEIKPTEIDEEYKAIIDSIKEVAVEIIKNNPNIPSEATFAVQSIESPSFLVNYVASNMDLRMDQKQKLLSESNQKFRATETLRHLNVELQKVKLKNDIHSKTRSEMDQQQREYFLNQQMRTIQEELGGNTQEEEVNELRERATQKQWSEDVAEHFDKELKRMQRLNPQMPEFSIQRNYLEFMLDLPWDMTSKDKLDLKRAEKVLDEDHYGLEKVKERVLEYLAVLKLKQDMKSPIICLYGPPGVGKTSLGKSIARALNRAYQRMSLGGLHDESEIRGHRKTYIGAMPGRILQNIKKAGTSNPVFVLDEIDKLSRSAHGDPTSAMLEVLDPEQNTAFYDNYLEMGYDLSKVLFIATANDVSQIPAPLRDRMEMVQIHGYTVEEKTQIAKKYLLPKQLEAHGLQKGDVVLGKRELEFIVDGYTRESGVRTLEKHIAKVVRNAAKDTAMDKEIEPKFTKAKLEEILGPPREANKYENNLVPGVVTGLAWTSVGGDILFIESIISKGNGDLSMTGNLGKVMKESAQIALEYIKAHHEKLGIPLDLIEKSNVHVHVPEGAVPKDGPSAGVTMLTSIVSTFTRRKVKANIAMTGEITLRGKVLPVGGIKEKILAAKRAGIKQIVLSEDNRKDVLEIEKTYVKGLIFNYVKTMEEVLDIALLKTKG
ncbi:endopeptidase La [Flavobacteriaceae bacterium Ap0902]|nr:endopeptidase La [Flavobacteriaceae bacterium Ap0902]